MTTTQQLNIDAMNEITEKVKCITMMTDAMDDAMIASEQEIDQHLAEAKALEEEEQQKRNAESGEQEMKKGTDKEGEGESQSAPGAEAAADAALDCFEALGGGGEAFEMNDTRIAVIGNVDSGKSTVIGVLTSGSLDNGRGQARSYVMKHRHELDNGRTSAVTVEIMGFTSHGSNQQQQQQQVIPTARHHDQRWHEVMEKSDHTVSLIDLCGHEKYLKTTLFGLTGLMPDYAMLVVGGNMGVQVMTREHISLACALHIPMYVIVTKVDICPPNIMKTTKMALAKLLRSHNKMPFPVKDEESLQTAIDAIVSERVTPVFTISSVTGQGMDLLKSFIGSIKRLPSKYTLSPTITSNTTSSSHEDPQQVHYERMPSIYFPLDGVYEVKGVGVIIGGTLVHGCISIGDTLYLGPDRVGAFIQVSVKSMESRRQTVSRIIKGQSATLAVKPLAAYRKVIGPVLKKTWVRKGMVLVDGYTSVPAASSATGSTAVAAATVIPSPIGPILPPKAIREFEASVVILHHSTTISPRYQAVVHCGVIRQAAEIVRIGSSNSSDGHTLAVPSTAATVDVEGEREGAREGEEVVATEGDTAVGHQWERKKTSPQQAVLRTGERSIVRFRFLYFAEYILPGATFIFREGKAKGIGKILKTFPVQPLSG